MCEASKEELNEVLDALRRPFHPSNISWKPGAVKGDRALALAYADLRAYMNRLDEVCGSDWSVAYEPWGEDRIICRLTIMGITRSSTGETTNESERSEIGGTVAESQAFKRAGAMFGLGRYLYTLPSGWADWDAQKRQFTDKAKAKLTGILVQHYRRATESKMEMAEAFAAENEDDEAESPKKSIASNDAPIDPEFADLLNDFNALGEDLYSEQWEQVCKRNAHRISGGKTKEAKDLSPDQIQQLITGMQKLKSQREPVAET